MSDINTDTFVGPSFGLRNRFGRLLWNFTWWILVMPSPRPLHAWRRLVLRVFGAKIGPGVHIYPSAKIWAPWNLECGEQSSISDRAIIYDQGRVVLGRRAVVSQGAHLCAGTHDYMRPGMPLVTGSITIGADAWLAAECFVMPNVTIGDGAVIGARSVVTKDMPPWTVCAGHPCVPLKPRPHANE